MILVTGGSGFIGSHVVRALCDLGEQAVIVQRRTAEVPHHLAGLPVVAERGDVRDLNALRDISARRRITGIVHLAGYDRSPAPTPVVPAARRELDKLLNIVQVAEERAVRRVSVASTIGVYGGATAHGALTEDTPVGLSAAHPIPRFKKINELLAEQLSEAGGLEIVNLRISGTWGPLGHEDPFFAAPALVYAAANGAAPDLSTMLRPATAHDALDLCYVKDTGRAIALLQTARHLNHRTYNVASGRSTSNADISKAIRSVVPDADVDLPDGIPHAPTYLDITRIRDDTGYTPEFDTEHAAADYIAWLRNGHPR